MRFLCGFIFGCSLIACAAAPIFPYRFYHISGNGFQGTLLGEKPADDMPFSKCAPVNGKQQCGVFLYPEITAMVTDYKQCKSDLAICQRQCR